MLGVVLVVVPRGSGAAASNYLFVFGFLLFVDNPAHQSLLMSPAGCSRESGSIGGGRGLEAMKRGFCMGTVGNLHPWPGRGELSSCVLARQLLRGSADPALWVLLEAPLSLPNYTRS